MESMNNKVIYFLCLLWGISSCESDESSQIVKSGNKKAIIEIDSTDVFSSSEYEFALPQPFALSANFQEAGLTYDAQRMNSADLAGSYKTQGKRLLNFGVYSTDLVYNILNDRPQESLKYFKVLKDLAESIGMGVVFSEDDLALKVESNIANREVLEDLLIDIHERSQEYLQDNDMRQLAAIQFTGAWVEAMYLASFDFSVEETNDMSAKIDDQMTLLRNAIFALETFENRDVDLNAVLTSLKELQEMYTNLESVQSPVAGIPKLTKEDVEGISNHIQNTRQLIVS